MGSPKFAVRRGAVGRFAARRVGFTLLPGMTVGLYGGSFNPVHEGHAHVARTALVRLRLDRLVWLVSPQNPLKSTRETADLDGRLAEVRRWARGPAMIVTDLERTIGARYTIDTVRWMKRRFPGVHFIWIMGADSQAGFHRWRGWTELVREMPIAVISRPGAALRGRLSRMARTFGAARVPARQAAILGRRAPPAWTYLAAPYHHMSSTALRRRAARAG